MRITNKMMTNNVLHNIGNNKQLLSKLENQYSTGKKIQKPSDDPIVAVRALKLRTNLSELTQYVEKNIPDALNWMDTTESSMNIVNEILRQMNTYCDQGANDTLTATDRDSIITNLKELKQQIYQEGTSNYAGRYVFTGYKTDTPLVFENDTDEYTYQITENLTFEDVTISSTVINTVDLNAYKENGEVGDKMPTQVQTYRMRLSYMQLDKNEPATPPATTPPDIKLTYSDADGNMQPMTGIKTVSITDANAFQPGADEVHFIPETGELIFGENKYKDIYKSETIQAEYAKSEFNKNDLRPEHYFNCARTEKSTGKKVNFEKKNQEIQYEINFNQKLTVNTQGDAVFSHDIGRALDDIINSVNDVLETEGKMAEVERLLKDEELTDENRKKLETMQEQLESEFTLRTAAMQKSFSRGLTHTAKQQNKVNEALSTLGGSYNRVLLTQSRLEDQQVDFEDLLSVNEDVDLVDTIIKMTSAETIYNSSLSAASKLVQTSLLDFL